MSQQEATERLAACCSELGATVKHYHRSGRECYSFTKDEKWTEEQELEVIKTLGQSCLVRFVRDFTTDSGIHFTESERLGITADKIKIRDMLADEPLQANGE
jgi:hypothetical protein